MKIQVIIGSTRPQRKTDRLAKWVAHEAKNIEGLEVELVDLGDYDLPMLDEPISPQYNPDRKPNPVAQKWLNKLNEADGYVIVTPEYNRSFSAVLKNALDYVDYQLQKKPVALVAHGSTGGAQAVGQLRGVIPGLLTVTTPKASFITARLGEIFDEDGNMLSTDNHFGASLQATLEELIWYANALKKARA